jgi:hypothetical protein
MSNQAYLSVWCPDFPEGAMLERLGAFLSTVPFSAGRPGFSHLAIRAVDAAEAPLIEQDMGSTPLDAAGIVAIASEYLHRDCSYETSCHWDLSFFDAAEGKWKTDPQPLAISCHGEEYDHAFWRDNGHFEVDLGFEHFFTGHAGLLGIRRNGHARAESPEEARFLEAMAWPENLERYQQKTRENIRKLLDWIRRIESAVPVDRVRSWSEGEENFESRLEEILAVH